MKTIQLQITCIISTLTNVLVVCILKFKQLLDWLVRFDRRDTTAWVGGLGGGGKGIKGFVLAKKRGGVLYGRRKRRERGRGQVDYQYKLS